MIVLGVAGSAKNTGKTTTLMATVSYFLKRTSPQNLLLTSIGYDGEDFDNITGLPKPRIEVPQGSCVATALPLLKASSADFQDLSDTGVRTSLGRLFVGRAKRQGKVVLAGPTSTRDLNRVLKFGSEDAVVLLDGAFSRLAPMVAASHLILATGAARDKDSHRLAKELEAIYTVMSLPISESCNEYDLVAEGGLFLKGQEEDLGWRLSLLEQEEEKAFRVLVPGIANPDVFGKVLDIIAKSQKKLHGTRDTLGTFVFHHPVSMLLSGNIQRWTETLKSLGEMGYKAEVERAVKFLGFTINPYVPEHLPSGKFIATYVPPEAFLEDIRKDTNAHCTDIVLEGTGILYSWLSKIPL